jgi:hypothetical protein
MTLDLFAPVGLSSRVVPALAPVSLLAAVGWLVRAYLGADERMRVRATAGVILALVWLGVFTLGALGSYPFGGLARHQFVLFPFLALVCLAVADAVVRRLGSGGARTAFCLAFAAATLATAASGLRPGQKIEEFSPTRGLWPAEIQQMMHERGPDDAIYAGRIDVIALFSNFRDHRWTGTSADAEFDAFVVDHAAGPAFRVLRSTEWWLPSPLDDAATVRLAEAMRRHSAAHAWVLALVVDARPVTAARRDDEPVRRLLADHGLVLDRRLVFASGEILRVTEVGG